MSRLPETRAKQNELKQSLSLMNLAIFMKPLRYTLYTNSNKCELYNFE